MSFRTIAWLSTFLAFAAMGPINSAMAGQVHRCDSCTNAQKKNKALTTTPLGLAYVFDIPNAELTMWEVRYDGELRMKTADQTDVDPGAYNMFLNVLSDAAAPPTANGQITLPLAVGIDHGSRFSSDPLAGFETYDAYDIARSGTLRSQLGLSIANSLVGGPGNYDRQQIGQVLLSALLNLTGGTMQLTGYTFVIHWHGGSTTTFTLTGSDTTQATYVFGASRDSNGAPIPDATVNTDAAGLIFTGEWTFNTPQTLEDWVNEMAFNGVPITGSRGTENKVACVRVDGTLSCHYL
ncbi:MULTISPECIES: hypothetical protein [unclassified Lysobacter]|uniref:hypothetical protein n=1 Tax=unclassified Lysobacter TaxID=2635362 RepID=UPI001BE59833|nr:MULTISPECIES: hypothetical protein [unclassified Lysobacter]MBT2746185.1 hypothetical protein [Lysobacter sp. ISL-42]MBT2750730.1 hypothetical protein [Lysobacter sp. ISL-50]MBT2776123.1 hypothetical protein [Lysobacter sp. ISL-54]MBT2784629.1 hypothetical protein [Lysobacter sp. ISL-52]